MRVPFSPLNGFLFVLGLQENWIKSPPCAGAQKLRSGIYLFPVFCTPNTFYTTNAPRVYWEKKSKQQNSSERRGERVLLLSETAGSAAAVRALVICGRCASTGFVGLSWFQVQEMHNTPARAARGVPYDLKHYTLLLHTTTHSYYTLLQ